MSEIRRKVLAGAIGAGTGSALSTAVLWALGVFAFGAPMDAAHADAAVAAVPGPLAALLVIAVPALLSFVSGYVVAESKDAPAELPATDAEEEYEPKHVVDEDVDATEVL